MAYKRLQRRARKRGAALIIAVTLLAIFVTLGMFYVRNMSLELEKTLFVINQARAREAATGGVYAAIGDLQRAAAENQIPQVIATTRTYPFPVYGAQRTTAGLELAPVENRRVEASVVIADESGKINLNHAPASVLQRVLNVDGVTARNITSSLPRADGEPVPTQAANSGWLLDAADLVSRGLLTPEQFAALDKDLITTWTVADHAAPQGFLNINAASPEVLAAILDVPLETAQQVAAVGPFDSLEALAQAAGKESATFNIKPDPGNPAAWPAPLTSDSRCFRIVSEAASVSVAGQAEYDKAASRVEAVVVLGDNGEYEILYWNAGRSPAAA